MYKYKVAIIDDNKSKVDLLSNSFEMYEHPFEVVEMIIDSSEWTKEIIVEKLKDERVDGVITDYLLTSKNNGIDYNGDKVVQELLLEFRNLPIIMISEEKQKALSGDIDEFMFIERSEFADHTKEYLDKIYKLISNRNKLIDKYENDIITLLSKGKLDDEGKAKLIKLDNYLEETLLYDSKVPNYFKDNSILESLNKNLETLNQILEKMDDA